MKRVNVEWGGSTEKTKSNSLSFYASFGRNGKRHGAHIVASGVSWLTLSLGTIDDSVVRSNLVRPLDADCRGCDQVSESNNAVCKLDLWIRGLCRRRYDFHCSSLWNRAERS